LVQMFSPDDQKLTIETARVIRVGFLQQNAYHKDDTYVPLEKQFRMMKAILKLYDESLAALGRGAVFSEILATGIFEKVIKMKYEIPNDNMRKFLDLDVEIEQAVRSVKSAEEEE